MFVIFGDAVGPADFPITALTWMPTFYLYVRQICMDIRKYGLPKNYFLKLFNHKDFIRSTENLKKNTYLDFKLIRITIFLGKKLP